MARSRIDLDVILRGILGTTNVYFQPPNGLKMKYPAIVYTRQNFDNKHADDKPYVQSSVYQIIVIDKNPDSEIVSKIAQLPYCRHDRFYITDNLNHDVFTIYF